MPFRIWLFRFVIVSGASGKRHWQTSLANASLRAVGGRLASASNRRLAILSMPPCFLALGKDERVDQAIRWRAGAPGRRVELRTCSLTTEGASVRISINRAFRSLNAVKWVIPKRFFIH